MKKDPFEAARKKGREARVKGLSSEDCPRFSRDWK